MIHLAIYELDAALEEDFARWYEADHAPAMLSRPGWRSVRRYQCTDGQPYASIYELDDDVSTEPHIEAAPFRGGPFVARGVRTITRGPIRRSIGPAPRPPPASG